MNYGPEQFQAETGVSRETLIGSRPGSGCLEETSAHTNLVGRGTLTEFWHRHALDSWQVLELMPEAARWADLGAGAGFPGLAIAFGLMERGVEAGHRADGGFRRQEMAFVNQVIKETKRPRLRVQIAWNRSILSLRWML
jgi:16S rRNA (guanine527-N7)-methyltransferase